jgi:hypothetical protein
MNESKMICDIIDIIVENGMIPGAHHKQWVIDQVLRAVLGAEYADWLAENDHWDQGVAP